MSLANSKFTHTITNKEKNRSTEIYTKQKNNTQKYMYIQNKVTGTNTLKTKTSLFEEQN